MSFDIVLKSTWAAFSPVVICDQKKGDELRQWGLNLNGQSQNNFGEGRRIFCSACGYFIKNAGTAMT